MQHYATLPHRWNLFSTLPGMHRIHKGLDELWALQIQTSRSIDHTRLGQRNRCIGLHLKTWLGAADRRCWQGQRPHRLPLRDSLGEKRKTFSMSNLPPGVAGCGEGVRSKGNHLLRLGRWGNFQLQFLRPLLSWPLSPSPRLAMSRPVGTLASITWQMFFEGNQLEPEGAEALETQSPKQQRFEVVTLAGDPRPQLRAEPRQSS